jgi:hypothetical protein
MASKTGKKARAAAQRQGNAPTPKDDGSRWSVVRDGQQVYLGSGVTRAMAEHLNNGLLVPGELVQVNLEA